jgi:hypothetical protein
MIEDGLGFQLVPWQPSSREAALIAKAALSNGTSAGSAG